MTTLALEVAEVNPALVEALDLADDVWTVSDEQLAAMAEESALDDAWERACDLGHGSW